MITLHYSSNDDLDGRKVLKLKAVLHACHPQHLMVRLAPQAD